MESSNVTEQRDPLAGVDEEDPFAGTDIETLAAEAEPEGFGASAEEELEAGDPPTPPGESAGPTEPPVVNREGERVPDPTGFDPTTGSFPGGAAPSAEPTSQEEAPAEVPSQPAPPAASQEPSGASGVGDTPNPENGLEAPGATDGLHDEAPVSPEGASGDAAAPQRRRKRQSADAARLYRILYQTAKGTWTEMKLDVAAIKDHVRKHEGESWIEANNVDQARRLAYAAAGRPEDGVRIVAIAAKSWAPKTVKPRVVPERMALDIS